MGKPHQSAPLHRASDEELERAAQISQLLADRTRLGILELLLIEEECSVGEIAQRLERPIPAVSQHLAKLRWGKIVQPRQEGTRVFYSLIDEHAREVVTHAVVQAEHVVDGAPPHHRGADGRISTTNGPKQ